MIVKYVITVEGPKPQGNKMKNIEKNQSQPLPACHLLIDPQLNSQRMNKKIHPPPPHFLS